VPVFDPTVDPLNVTDQFVPEGKPVSEKVAGLVAGVTFQKRTRTVL
jgi:hypothetical protein